MKRNYPEEIEQQTNEISKIVKRRDEARERQEELTDIITGAVLTELDPATGKLAFTNDKARELAIRERQRASNEFQKWRSIAEQAESERLLAAARLERLRGEFAIFKREYDEQIAEKWAGMA